jgi:hypothetical protein
MAIRELARRLLWEGRIKAFLSGPPSAVDFLAA